MRDDDDQTPSIESDRAAILARRKQFIALALTGLATAGCDKPEDQPIKQPTEAGSAGESQPPPGEPPAPPQPCLSIAPPEPLPETPPQVCLKVAAPPDDNAGETGKPVPEPAPEKAPPRPCLKKAPPKQG